MEPIAYDDSIYHSPQEFESLIERIRTERAARLQARILYTFHKRAVEQLQAEIRLSREAGDDDICDYLETLLGGFLARMESTPMTLFSAATTLPERQDKTCSATEEEGLVLDGPESRAPDCPAVLSLLEDTAPNDTPIVNTTISAVIVEQLEERKPEPQVAEPLRAPDPALTREERKQKTEDLVQAARIIRDRLNELGEQAVDPTATSFEVELQGRAILCAIEWVHSESHACGVDGALEQSVVELRELADDLLAEVHAQHPPVMSADRKHRSEHAGSLKPDVWLELESRFSFASEVYPELLWFIESWKDININERRDLLNSIGAVCQLLKIALERFKARDGIYYAMYSEIKNVAKVSQCFLNSLNADYSEVDLELDAERFPTCLHEARANWEINFASRNKAQVKEDARIAFEALVASRADFGTRPELLDADREQLMEALDGVYAAGIPVSDKRVRDALINVGPVLLGGQIRFAKLLGHIEDERKRRHLDVSPGSDELDAAEIDIEPVLPRELNVVRLWSTDKSLLLLGGQPRQKTIEELRELLECASVTWPVSKPGDKAQKFRSAISKADVVLVLKNFTGHDVGELARDLCKANSSHCLMLPSGYGVNKIVQQLYEYIERAKRG